MAISADAKIPDVPKVPADGTARASERDPRVQLGDGLLSFRNRHQYRYLPVFMGDDLGDAFGAVWVGGSHGLRNISQCTALRVLVGKGFCKAFGTVWVGGRQCSCDMSECLIRRSPSAFDGPGDV